MYLPWPVKTLKIIPLEELDGWSKMNTKDLVTFNYLEFNEYYNEAIRWNNRYAGSTNTEIRFHLESGGKEMTAYLHRFGM